MDIQIYMIDLQLLQTQFESAGDVGDVGQHLGRDEELVTADVGLFDGHAEFGLGLVDFGAVEVVVAQVDGRDGAVDAVLVELGLVAGLVPGGAGSVGKL